MDIWDAADSVVKSRETKPTASRPKERSIVQRLKDGIAAGAINSQLGYAALNRAELRLKGWSDERINRHQRALVEKFDKINRDDPAIKGSFWEQGAANVGRLAVDVIGNVIGGVDPTYVLNPGKSVLQQMGAQGAINAGVDAAGQGVQVERGIRDKFNPDQVAVSGAGGVVLRGAQGRGNVKPTNTKIKNKPKDIWDVEPEQVAPVKASTRRLEPPVKGEVTSPFGQRRAPKAGASTDHKGVDLAGNRGDPVFAPEDGTVTRVGRGNKKAGNWVEIDHGGGLTTRYLHLDGYSVKPGDQLLKGKAFARVGATGNVTGPHLHWTARQDGVPVDPMKLGSRQVPSRDVEVEPETREIDEALTREDASEQMVDGELRSGEERPLSHEELEEYTFFDAKDGPVFADNLDDFQASLPTELKPLVEKIWSSKHPNPTRAEADALEAHLKDRNVIPIQGKDTEANISDITPTIRGQQVSALHEGISRLHGRIIDEGHPADPVKLEGLRSNIAKEMENFAPDSREAGLLRDTDEMLASAIAHQGHNPRNYAPEATDKHMGQEQKHEYLADNDENIPNKLADNDEETVSYGGGQEPPREPPQGPPRGPDEPPPPGGPTDPPSGNGGGDGSGPLNPRPIDPRYEGQSFEEKLKLAIDDIKPFSNKRKKMIHEERGRRFGKVAGIQKEGPQGMEGYKMELGALKGKIDSPHGPSVAHNFTEQDFTDIFSRINRNTWMTPGEKLTSKTALLKILGMDPESKIPTPGDLKLLSHIIDADILKGLLRHRPFKEKFWDTTADVLNIARSFMTTLDLSASLRQGILMIGRKEFYPAFVKMFTLFGNKRGYDALMDSIRSDPDYAIMRRAGVSFSEVGARQLDEHEEAFASNLAERIPVLGAIVRGSNYAYSGFLNKVRFDFAKTLIRQSLDAGLSLEQGGKPLKDIGSLVNNATGRGDLRFFGKDYNVAAPAFSGLLFSPRLFVSRARMLWPPYYATLSPVVRKEALKTIGSFAAIATTVLALAKFGGAEVETDQKSSDFGKIKVGDTRYDIMGGHQQFLVLYSRLWEKAKTTAAGKRVELDGKKFGSDTRLTILANFMRNKFSPVASFIADYFDGKNPIGEKFEGYTDKPPYVGSAVYNRFIPMVAQDLWEMYAKYGPEGIFMGFPALFGVGVQDYDSSKPPAGETGKTKEEKAQDAPGYQAPPGSTIWDI